MPLRRLVKRLGHKAWFAKMNKAIVPLDKGLAKITGGRVVALGLVPSLRIVTIGKKSGVERLQPLAYVPDGDNIILIGSNWGGPKHPGWSYNLIANPQARVCIKGKWRNVNAKLAKGDERGCAVGQGFGNLAGLRHLRKARLKPPDPRLLPHVADP